MFKCNGVFTVLYPVRDAVDFTSAHLIAFQFHFEGETRRRRANDEDSTLSTARSKRGSQRRVTDKVELESLIRPEK